ncbi:MAG: hypothetical protein AMDU4_FER2C00084G0007 [Ferroplasma sp. Type II]|jgi:hypothetical protein|nr:MAG: hypothetical protein AMDU4_FER2C00084G0007 [Ferroplasma sp. Type II]
MLWHLRVIEEIGLKNLALASNRKLLPNTDVSTVKKNPNFKKSYAN